MQEDEKGRDVSAGVNLKEADFADVDEETLRRQAEAQAMLAVASTRSKMSDFDKETATIRGGGGRRICHKRTWMLPLTSRHPPP